MDYRGPQRNPLHASADDQRPNLRNTGYPNDDTGLVTVSLAALAARLKSFTLGQNHTSVNLLLQDNISSQLPSFAGTLWESCVLLRNYFWSKWNLAAYAAHPAGRRRQKMRRRVELTVKSIT